MPHFARLAARVSCAVPVLWLGACAPAPQAERDLDPACAPLLSWANGACQQRVAGFRACPGISAELFRACPELCSPDFPCSAAAAPPALARTYATAATFAFSDPDAERIGDTQFGGLLLADQAAGAIAIGVRQQDGILCGPAGPLTYPAALAGEGERFTIYSALLRRTPERCTLTFLLQSGVLSLRQARVRGDVRTKYLNARCEGLTGHLHEYVETWRQDDEAAACAAP